jgi:hypothetical protein
VMGAGQNAREKTPLRCQKLDSDESALAVEVENNLGGPVTGVRRPECFRRNWAQVVALLVESQVRGIDLIVVAQSHRRCLSVDPLR